MPFTHWKVWPKGEPERVVSVVAETAFEANQKAGPRLGNPSFPSVECENTGIVVKIPAPVEVATMSRHRVNEIVVAAIVDRLRQYDNSSAIVVALENLATYFEDGEHWKAFDHGELDDLIDELRALKMLRKRPVSKKVKRPVTKKKPKKKVKR